MRLTLPHITPLHTFLSKKVWILLLFFAVGGFFNDAVAQKVKVKIYGEIKNETTNKRMDGVTVSLYESGSKVSSQKTSGNGKFDFDLDYDKIYKFKFEKPGFVTKKLEVDTRNIPPAEKERGEFIRPIDMTLFEDIEDVDFSVLEEPIGKFAYDYQMNDILHDEKHTKQMKKKLDKMFKELDDKQKELEKKKKDFEKLVKDADKSFKKENYQDAVDQYEAALKLFPEDPDVQLSLEDAEYQLKEQQSAQEKEKEYENLIAEADDFFDKESYDKAREKYLAALDIRPGEKHPDKRLDEIDEKLKELEEQQAQQEQYDKLVAEADNAFDAKNYEEAKTKYNQALDIFKKDHPKDRIGEIDGILEQLEAEKEREEEYNNTIAKADEAFSQEEFERAKGLYKDASKLKESESYPNEKISEIEGILEKLAAEQALEEEYNKLIAEADKAFDKENFEEAKSRYQEASTKKADENYPKERLSEIDTILAEMAEEKAKAEKYEQLITEADDAMKGDNYTAAKEKYTQASELQPEEQYPKDKINEINKKLEELEQMREQYEQLIADAENAFNNEEYEDAKKLFQEAKSTKSDETYPDQKIEEIDGILKQLAEQEKIQQQFDDLIAKADKAFDGEDYTKAKDLYNEAIDLKGNEEHPKNRINEIDGIIQEKQAEQAKQEQYDQLITDGDTDFKNKDYDKAKAKFAQAKDLMPEESYPDEKIEEIDAILQELAEQEAQRKDYEEKIAKADLAFNNNELQDAKSFYEEASNLLPDEKYPKDKIKEIDTRLAELAKLEEKYDNIVSDADKAFDQENFEKSKELYTEASNIKPDEAYPKERLEVVNKKLQELAEEQAREEQFNNLIADADKLFNNKEYRDAKGKYEESLELKPDASHPTEKINEIDDILQKIAEEQAEMEEYNNLIAQADEAFDKAEYDNAIGLYKDAQALNDGDRYPQNQIDKIEGILSDIEAKNKKYDDLLAQGKQAFDQENYSNAKDFYKRASDVKPDEQLPKDKISEINQLLNELAEEEELDAKYEELKSKGDLAFDNNNFNDAKDFFTQASDIKPSENYPKEKIDEINQILEEMKQQEALENQYAEAIEKGDMAFNDDSYKDAENFYKQATSLKPDEQYPKDKLKEIEGLLADMIQEKEKDEEYQSILAKGDLALKDEEYTDARRLYEDALELKPGEEYPQSKIKEIDKMIDSMHRQEEMQKEYDQMIALADKNFDNNEYSQAKSQYEAASELIPKENYPKERITEIDSILADMEDAQQKEEEYAQIIKEADNAVGGRDYNKAKSLYNEALQLKPGEEHPKNKLAEIEEIQNRLKSAQEMEEKYEEAIAKGDMAFNNEDFENAKDFYEQAKTYKPEERYPKNKIDEINKKLSELEEAKRAEQRAQEREEEFNSLVAKGDMAFGEENYRDAIGFYEDAANLKPDNTTVPPKIKKAKEALERIQKEEEEARLADQKEREGNRNKAQQEYDRLIGIADNALDARDYDSAEENYKKAKRIRPTQTYPDDQLREIDRLRNASQREKEEREVAEKVKEEKEKKKNLEPGEVDFGTRVHGKSGDDILAEMEEERRKYEDERYEEIRDFSDRVREEQTARKNENAERSVSKKQEANEQQEQLTEMRQTGEENRQERENEVQSFRNEYENARSQKRQDANDRQYKTFDDLNRYKKRRKETYDNNLAEANAERIKNKKEQLENERKATAEKSNDVSAKRREELKEKRESLDYLFEVRSQQTDKRTIEVNEQLEERQQYEGSLRERNDNDSQERLKESREHKETLRTMFADRAEQTERRTQEVNEKQNQFNNFRKEAQDNQRNNSENTHQANVDKKKELNNMFNDRAQQTERRTEQVNNQQEAYNTFHADAKRKNSENSNKRHQEAQERRGDLNEMFDDRARHTQLNTDNVNKKQSEVNQFRAKITDKNNERSKAKEDELRDMQREVNEMFADRDQLREEGAERARQQRDEYYEFSGELKKDHASRTDDNLKAKRKMREQHDEMKQERGKIAIERTEDTYRDKEKVLNTQQGYRDASYERLLAANENIIDTRENLANKNFSNNERIAENYDDLNDYQENLNNERGQRNKKHGEERDAKRETLYKEYAFTPPSEYNSDHQEALRQKFGKGITEEIYEDGNRKTIRRIVVTDNSADDYHAVVNKWATYYFKNGRPITKHKWEQETK